MSSSPKAATPSGAVRTAYPLASALFFASGFTGLAYEVIWFKHFTHVWGSSTLATAAVVGSFLLGLGLGAQIMGRAADRVRVPIFWYGVSEIAIGALALAIPGELTLLRSLAGALHPSLSELPLAHYGVRLALTFVVLGPPTILMGGTLPWMVRQFTTDATGLRRSTGWLYAINTIGAAIGCYVCGFHLLAKLGLSATNFVIAGSNVVIGVVAILVARRIAHSPAAPNAKAIRDDHDAAVRATSLAARSRAALWFATVLTGFSALVLQIVWVRQLALVLGGTTYAFTSVLFVVLVGIGAGSLLFRLCAAATKRLELLSAAAVLALVLATVLGQRLIEPLTAWVGSMRFHRETASDNALVCVAASAVLELVPALAMGFFFPYLVHVTRRGAEHAGEAVGRIYAFNTLGTVLGASLTSTLLIPAAGSAGAIQVALALYAVVFALLVPFEKPRSGVLAAIAGAAAVLLALLAIPRHDPRLTNSGRYFLGADAAEFISPKNELLYFEEGRLANVLVTRVDGDVFLRVDGKVDATSGIDMATQLALAYYPRIFRPGARDVCVIGYGSGSTAGASALFAGTKVVCCEIEPAVYRASRFFSHVNHDPPSLSNFRIVFDDGRNHVQGTPQTFDLVISEPSNPWMPGIANLFTREFYESLRSKLKPGGMVAQWIQLYDFSLREYALIARTMAHVFPHTALVRIQDRDTILLASMEPIEASAELADRAQALVDSTPAAKADLIATFGTADVRRLLIERWFLDGAGLAALVAKDRSGGGLNTDINLRLEFDAPRRLFVQKRSMVPEVDLEIVSTASVQAIERLFGALGAGSEHVSALWNPLNAFRDYGQTDKALALTDFAQRIAPAEVAFEAERCFLALAGGTSAGEASLQALDELPVDTVAAIGFRLWQKERFGAAVAVNQRLLARTPRSAENWANLGVSLQSLERWSEAETAFQKALEIDPARADIRQLYAEFRERRAAPGSRPSTGTLR